MNSLIYETKLAPWSLKQFQSLDNLFTEAYKFISKNQSSFPTKLLHMKTEKLGLEYPQFSHLSSRPSTYEILLESTSSGDDIRIKQAYLKHLINLMKY